ncbi:MAG: hypothetical protein M1831_002876 [Alyxoria varia]|nr:MAG: hypothetical protein M1831_002876 [Alyxoria varia]
MSYIVPPNQYWSRAKSAISVVCACLPTLAKIFEKQSRKDISLYFRKRMPLSPLKYSESSDYCSDTSKKGGEVDDIIKLEEPPRLVCEPQPSQQYDVV